MSIAALHIKCDWCEDTGIFEDESPELEAVSEGWKFVVFLHTGDDEDPEYHYCSGDCMEAAL